MAALARAWGFKSPLPHQDLTRCGRLEEERPFLSLDLIPIGAARRFSAAAIDEQNEYSEGSRQDAMTQLRVEQCELKYEGAFLKPAFSLVDCPGKVCDLLLGALEAFGCTGADLVFEGGEPDERGVKCNVDELDATVTIHGNRIEIRCANFANAANVATVLADVWSRLARLNIDIAAKTHSFLFEADTEIRGPSSEGIANHLNLFSNLQGAQLETI